MQSYYIIFEKQKIWFHNSIFLCKKLEKHQNPPPICCYTACNSVTIFIPVCVTFRIIFLIFPDFIVVLCLSLIHISEPTRPY